MQQGEPQVEIVQIKNISTDNSKKIRCVLRMQKSLEWTLNGSSVSWSSGKAAVDVLEAVPFMTPVM